MNLLYNNFRYTKEKAGKHCRIFQPFLHGFYMTVAHDDNSFDSATLSRRLNNFNCEFYLQSQVAISEFAEMIIKNVQYIEENANILDPKSIQGFVKKKKIREVTSNAGHETEQRNS